MCGATFGVIGVALLWAGAEGAAAEPVGDAVAALVEGNQGFALDLYARLRQEPGNLCLSPHSISTALAMTYAGARGETARQMADVLHFSIEPERLHAAFAAMMSSGESAGGESGYRLHVANALWGQRGYGLLNDFLGLTKEYYGAGFHEVDFAGATEHARQAINRWVENQTQRRIRESLQQGDLDPATVLVLTNATWFKGDWASRFDQEHTTDGTFHVDASDSVVVPTMHQLAKLPLAILDDVDVLELPYVGDRLSMVLLLPKTVDGLAAVERLLSRENLDRWLGSLHPAAVRVSLPRFTADTRFDLAKVLKAMGMIDAFSAARADFSGMSGRRGLFISLVIHQAQVEVSEEGTVAGAGTAVVLKKGPRPAAFAADHPFIYLVCDKRDGSILFLGRVANPAG